MDQNKRAQVAMFVTILVVLAVFSSFAYSLYTHQTPAVVLPSLQPDSSSTDSSVSPAAPLLQVEVNTTTVQAVIATLERTGSYYRQLSVETFWTGGSSTTSVQTWVDNGFTYVRFATPSGQVRYSLTANDTLYYWYDGSTTWLTAPANSLSSDLAQRIPTYEDVLALPAQQISDAGYYTYNDQLCIYVETYVDEFGYLERYWIGVENGLLVGSETVKDGRVVYSMRAGTSIQTPCPTDVLFALPDGTVLHSF